MSVNVSGEAVKINDVFDGRRFLVPVRARWLSAARSLANTALNQALFAT